MPNPPPISLPAGYAPAVAFGYADAESRLAMVSTEKPLPVSLMPAETPSPLVGTTSQTGMVGPFLAARDVPIIIALQGSWTGTVQLLRSTDGGATRLPLRVCGLAWGTYHESGVEQVWCESEDNVFFYLDITLLTGTLTYRVSQ